MTNQQGDRTSRPDDTTIKDKTTWKIGKTREQVDKVTQQVDKPAWQIGKTTEWVDKTT